MTRPVRLTEYMITMDDLRTTEDGGSASPSAVAEEFINIMRVLEMPWEDMVQVVSLVEVEILDIINKENKHVGCS